MELWKVRLKEARLARGLNKTQLKILTGVSNPTVTDWEKSYADGGIKEISGPNLTKLCAVLGIDAEWLLYGKRVEAQAFDKNVSPAPLGAKPIPVISAVQAGRMKEMESPYEPGDGYAVEYADDKLSRWAFALEVEGKSMLPKFSPGDRIIIDPELAPNPGDFVVARNCKEEATFKKYRPRGIGQDGQEVFELVPLNEDYPTLRSDETPLQVIGVMTEHRQRYRRLK